VGESVPDSAQTSKQHDIDLGSGRRILSGLTRELAKRNSDAVVDTIQVRREPSILERQHYRRSVLLQILEGVVVRDHLKNRHVWITHDPAAPG